MFKAPIHNVLTVALSAVCMMLVVCGGGSPGSSASPNGSTTTPSTVPHFDHVAIVVLENASYNEVIGNASMPYLNKLASQGALLQRYYANAHPSIPNYFMLTTGQTITFDDAYSSTVSVDNLSREFMTSGVTWKAYEENIPGAGYASGDSGLYIERHDPFSYFSDVRNSSTESANIVSFAQLSTDMSRGSLPNFLWLGPNALNSAHNCPSSNPSCSLNDRLAAADAWLSTNIAQLLANSTFSLNGLLIVVFDEGEKTDLDHGGGHIVAVLAGAHVKAGYTSTTTYQHQDILGLIGHALQLQTIPGAGATGGSMTEFFQ